MLEKTLESPLDSKEVTPVNLKEINLQFFGRTDDEAEAPILWQPDDGNMEDRWGRGWQRIRWLYRITSSMEMNLSKLREIAVDLGAWRAAVHGIAKSLT